MSPTNKVYIGQSWNLKRREDAYRRLNCKRQSKLYSSLISHGFDNHVFSILYEFPIDVSQSILDLYETFYWQQYKNCGFEMLNLKEPTSYGKHSNESKKRIGDAQRGEKNAMKRPEIAKKQGLSMMGEKNPMHNKNGHRHHLSKKVNQYDKTGYFIKTWDCQRSIQRELNISQGHISQVCNGNRKYAGGYIWKFKTTK